MNNMAKRVRQMLTMLLAVSMLAGSIPVNAFAMEELEPVSEMTAETEGSLPEENSDIVLLSEDTAVSVNDTDANETEDQNVSAEESVEEEGETEETAEEEGETEETVEEETEIEEAVSDNDIEEIPEEPENAEAPVWETVSGNQVNSFDLAAAAEETGEEIEITFSVAGMDGVEDVASLVDIIQIVRNEDGKIINRVPVEETKVKAIEGKPFEFELETKEGYKVSRVTANGTKVPTSEAPGEESIYVAELWASGTIEIILAELEQVDVTFSYDEKQISNLTVFVTGENETITVKDKVPVKVWEESYITFEFKLEDKVIVKNVTVNGEKAPTPVIDTKEKSYRYTLKEPVKEELEIKIETSLDEKQCYIVDVAVMGHKNSVQIYYEGNPYRDGDRILMKGHSNNAVSIYETDKEYKIKQVLLGTEELTGTESKYPVTFAEDAKGIEGAKALVIYTEPEIETGKEKKVIFANSASNVTYTVNTSALVNPENIIRDELKKNTYTVKGEEPYMEFSITYKKGYGAAVEIPEGILYDLKVSENTTTYTETYSLVVKTLGDKENPTIIKIDEYTPKRVLSVLYDEDKIENLYAIVDGKYEEGTMGYDSVKQLEKLNFEYPHGTEIVFQIETTDEYILERIVETAEGKELSRTEANKKEYTYTAKAEQDKNIELQLKGEYTTELYLDSEQIVKEKEIYSVKGGEEYTFYLYKGEKISSNRQIISKAVLKNGKTVIGENLISAYGMKLEIPKKDAAGKSLEGKTLILEIDYQENGKNYTHKEQIKIIQETQITSVTGVKSGKISQTAGTVKEYKFSSNLPDTEDRFVAKVFTSKGNATGNEKEELDRKANEDFKAEIVEDKLRITVKTPYEEEEALVKIFERGKEEEGEEIAGGSILVISKAPAFAEKTKPTVSLKNATNLNLVLSLSMKNLEELGYEEDEDGGKTSYTEYWYKIVGEPKLPKDTSKTPEEILNHTEKFTEYIQYTDVSQVGSIQVVDRADSENLQNIIDYSEGEFPYKTDHKIKVSLIQTTRPIEENEKISPEDIAFESKAVEINASTKVPSYETKLGVKTVKTSIYSGQKDVIVAYPVFSKATSYQEITKEDVNILWEKSVADAVQSEIDWDVDHNGNILFSAGTMAKPGKYVIEVTAQVEEGTVPAKKEFTVQVVQGIYQIDLETPKELYKQYKKEAVLKVGIAYNEENIEDKEDISLPKTKKVEWQLLDYDKKVIDKEHPDYEDYKDFTIKNGVVTIAKDFIVSGDPNKNTFYVQAVAKDFERKENEEEIIGRSEKIVITNRKVTLGELVLVKENEEDNTKYDLIAVSGQKVTADKVQGSKLVMLKKGTVERDWYTETDFVEISEDLEKLLVYSSSSKAVEIKDDKTINMKDIASGVKITVKVQDGSNVTSELKNLTITHAEAGALGVKVVQNKMILMNSFNNSEEKFYGPKDETLTVKIQEKDKNGDGVPIFGENYQLKIQGAKIMKSDKLLGEYEIVGTSDTIVIQLDNKTTGGSKVFTLKNAALNNTEVKNSKALSLKAEGTLKTGWFSKDEPQTITYTLPKESIGKYTHAYVSVNKLEYLDQKKEKNYRALITAALGSIGEIPQPESLETIGELHQLDSSGKVVLTFGAAEGEERYYIPEANFTYKLNISFGTMTDNYEFKAEAKTNAVTITTKDVKIVNAKLNTSYNMSIKEGGMVTLTLNNKKAELSSVRTLMNMNIKGKVNRFTDLFELDGNVLRLKPQEDFDSGEFSKLIADKNNLTGYISEYTYTEGNKEKTVYNTAIKVNLKDLVQKYSLSQGTVLAANVKKAKIDVNVNLLAGKNVVPAEYVYVPTDQKFIVTINDDGSLNFVSKDGVSIGSSNKCTVYVIPEGSYYIPELDKLYDEESGEQTESSELTPLDKAVKTYGIKLTASLAVKDQAKTAGKIKFTSDGLKPKFTAEHFVFTTPEELKGVYALKVPYTLPMEWEDEQGKEISISYDKSDVINISKTPEEDTVTITIDKQELRKVCESKSKKDSYGNTYGYGKTVTVKTAAAFGEKVKAETITFKITLPKQPLQFGEALKILNNDSTWTGLDVILEKEVDGKETALTAEELIDVNKPLVEETIKEILSVDGDLKYEIQNPKAIVPEENVNGSVTYTIKLIDVGAKKQTFDYATAKIELGELLKEPEDFKAEDGSVPELQKAMDGLEEVKNTTSMTTILEDIRESMKFGTKYKHLRLYAENVERLDATADRMGWIKGNFCIVSVIDKEIEPLIVPFEFEIAQLMNFEQAIEAVKEAIKDIKIYHHDINNNNQAKIKEIEDTANAALRKEGYFVEIPEPKFKYVDIYEQTTGKITIRISREGSDGLETREFTYMFQVSKQ